MSKIVVEKFYVVRDAEMGCKLPWIALDIVFSCAYYVLGCFD